MKKACHKQKRQPGFFFKKMQFVLKVWSLKQTAQLLNGWSEIKLTIRLFVSTVHHHISS